MKKKAVLYIAALVCAGVKPQAEDAATALSNLEGALYSNAGSFVEKSDWMRYDNGKYIGHVYREVRASIMPENAAPSGAKAFKGNFFVMEDTLRDLRHSARAVNAVVSAHFRIQPDGGMEIDNDRGFPSFRDFPIYKGGTIQPGAKWTARGERALDPLNDGAVVIAPFIAEYEYKGVELYKDIPVHRISARFASRYNMASARPIGWTNNYEQGMPQPFASLSGKHDVDILIRLEDGVLLLSRDNLDETFTWADGKTVRFRGFTLVFGQGINPMNREALVEGLSPTLDAVSGVEVSKVEQGVRLTIKDLQFKPNSAEMLEGDAVRLDAIAASLSQIPERSFLVEGHTAAAGSTEGDEELSLARAKCIVDELTARGIDAARFIYKGWGSARPTANNATEEGRKLNRRVEITIIE
ncbi:MAG: OmpA family protein [Spirochaetaceae bacterium]|nr:OmpA family protein [Spirochaetaceae bacterium]